MPPKKKRATRPAKRSAKGPRIATVKTANAPSAIGPYSQGMIANGFLFTAGQIAIDPATGQVITGDVRAQTERAMQNVAAVLAASGATWNDVVKTTVFLQDMSDFPIVNEIYGKALGEARPARSTVQVAGLPRGVLIEIDAIARVS